MPYGTPVKNTGAITWGLGATYLTFAGTTINVSFGPSDDATEAERDTMLQAVIDLLDGSPDFTVSVAYKQYSMTEEVTPTP
jgi:hypothetical protein